MPLILKGFHEAPAAGFTAFGLKTSPKDRRRFDGKTLKSLDMFPVKHLAVEAAERVRQVGPGNEGTKGSFSVDRLAEMG